MWGLLMTAEEIEVCVLKRSLNSGGKIKQVMK